MSFTINHTVQFRETDAAGVVYFANGLAICHGAYEASLAAVGINLREFFAPGVVAYPVVQASIDFHHPMRCGDQIQIWLQPERLDAAMFKVKYRLMLALEASQPVAQAVTRHVCIETQSRQRQPLPARMEDWLQRYGAD